jgi:hypothetical protein
VKRKVDRVDRFESDSFLIAGIAAARCGARNAAALDLEWKV